MRDPPRQQRRRGRLLVARFRACRARLAVSLADRRRSRAVLAGRSALDGRRGEPRPRQRVRVDTGALEPCGAAERCLRCAEPRRRRLCGALRSERGARADGEGAAYYQADGVRSWSPETFSVFVRGLDRTAVYPEIRWRAGDGSLIQASRGQVTAVGESWTRLVVSGKAPDGATSALLVVGEAAGTSTPVTDTSSTMRSSSMRPRPARTSRPATRQATARLIQPTSRPCSCSSPQGSSRSPFLRAAVLVALPAQPRDPTELRELRLPSARHDADAGAGPVLHGCRDRSQPTCARPPACCWRWAPPTQPSC